jgi:hypothetical protein
MAYLVDLLLSIPDVVWSGVVAAVLTSVLTLSAVLISNRSNTNRLRIQLEHDAAEKAKERTATLRREVYLRAVEELTKANSYLASLPQADLQKTNAAEGLQGFFVAAAKLQLVAEPKTALLVNQLVSAYAELLLRLLARIMPLQKARTDISISDDLYNQAQGQVTRVLAEMAKFTEAAHVDNHVFGALQRAFESYQGQAQKYATDRGVAWDEFNRLNIEFCRQLLTDLRVVGELLIPVQVEIRRDLDLISDLAAFREQMQNQWNRMADQLETLLRVLENG